MLRHLLASVLVSHAAGVTFTATTAPSGFQQALGTDGTNYWVLDTPVTVGSKTVSGSVYTDCNVYALPVSQLQPYTATSAVTQNQIFSGGNNNFLFESYWTDADFATGGARVQIFVAKSGCTIADLTITEGGTTQTIIVGDALQGQWAGVSGGSADPHLTLAYGGMADFRGINNTFFSMLSAPGINVALRTNDAVFMIKHNHRVDGSFMTGLAVNVMSGKEMVTVRAVADKATGFYVSNEEGDVISRNGQWTNWTGDGVVAEQLMLTTSIRAHDWEVNVTRKPVYNHVTGPKWRFDFTIRPLVSESSWTCFPHGLIGQSFDGTGIGLLGKMDDYDDYDVKTSAMAEGAIVGSAVDYIVDPTSPKFKYSRFFSDKSSKCAARDPNAVSGRRIRGSSNSVAGASD